MNKLIMLRIHAILFCFLALENVCAQIFTPVIDETALQFRVKQVDEFFVRFNFETDYKGDIPHDNSIDLKKKNLLTLFNLDAFTNSDKSYTSELTTFINEVIQNDVKLHYEDSTWKAEAICTLVYEGKKYDSKLWLQTERVNGVIFRWAITDIESTLFKNFPKNPKDTISISPADHGIGFITLPEMINLNRSSVGTSFSHDYKRSYLAVFDYLAASGKIKIGTITKVKFHFQLPFASFTLEHIEKEKGYNQGWLINELKIKK